MNLRHSLRTTLCLLLTIAATAAMAQAPSETFADNLSGPYRVAQLANGRVLVTEGFANQVTSFSDTGGDRTPFVANLQREPIAILPLSDGRVLVSNGETSTGARDGRILAIATDGTSSILATGFEVPRDMIQTGAGVLVVDRGTSGAGRVLLLNTDGTIEDDSFITGLNGPSGIVALDDGRLLVTDAASDSGPAPTVAARILAYQADGTFSGVFATDLGVGPNDIVQTDNGLILVVIQDADRTNTVVEEGEVRIYTASGDLVGRLGSGLNRPTGVGLLSDGRVLVTLFDADGSTTTENDGKILVYARPTSSENGGPALASIGEVYPNPSVAGSATVTVGVESSQHVRVAVYDVLGREVAVALDAPLAAGADTPVRLNTSTFSPGTYVVRVAGETFSETRPFVVVR